MSTIDQDTIKRMQAILHCSYEEAKALCEYDKQVATTKDTGAQLEYDLPPDKQKVANQMARTGTRKVSEDNPSKKRVIHKENPMKNAFITELYSFLADFKSIHFKKEEKETEIALSDVTITNKEREILFKLGEEWYTLTLSFKRNMTKGK